MSQVVKCKTRVSDRFTQSQSERTILEILRMSISCISFLRGFFNDEHFEDNVFQINNNNNNNNNNKVNNSNNTNTKNDKIKIKNLKKGVSDECDIINDWIDISIKNSIHDKYLKAINLSVITDKENPTDIFESYIFNIDYLTTSVQSISFNGNITLTPGELTKIQIFSLMKKIILLTQSLSPLPNKRYLSMRLLYNDKCPLDYYTENFIDCSNEKPSMIKLPENLIDDLYIQCGEINSVHHELSTCLISKSNMSREDYENSNLISIDPFDLIESNNSNNNSNNDNNDTPNNDMKLITYNNSQVSQVTKELYNVMSNFDTTIHDGQTQIMDSNSHSHNLNDNYLPILCSCSSNSYLSYSSLIQCKKCKKYSHKVCYSINSKDSSFTCSNCSNMKNLISKTDLLILFNLRKLIVFFQNNKTIELRSISDALNKLGYETDNKSIVETVVNAFSILIHKKILAMKNHKSFNHTLFNVDFDGLMIDNRIVSMGKFYIRFNSNAIDEINEILNPKFGYDQQVKETLTTMSQLNDETIFDEFEEFNLADKNNNYNQLPNKKVKKSIDIFRV